MKTFIEFLLSTFRVTGGKVVAIALLTIVLKGGAEVAWSATAMMAGGQARTIYLAADGSVWEAGGNGGTSPLRIFSGLSNVTAITGTGGGRLALRADGTVWSHGTAPRGGDEQLQGLSGIRAIAGTVWYGHALALKDDGTVWAWGSNEFGQLGDGSRTDRATPVQVVGLSGVAQIAASRMYSLALRSDGSVWMWGSACCGLTGSPVESSADPQPVQAVPKPIPGLTGISAIAAGDMGILALKPDGSLVGLGSNSVGSLGVDDGSSGEVQTPTPIPGIRDVIAISSGGSPHTLALKSDGTVWAWGNNNVGQLGIAESKAVMAPTQIAGLTDIMTIATTVESSMAMKRDGSVFAWGKNLDGELGDGTLQSRSEPRPVLAPGGSGTLNLLRPMPAAYNQLPFVSIELSASAGVAPLTVKITTTNISDPDGSIRSVNWETSDGQKSSGTSPEFTFRNAGSYRINLIAEDNSGGRGYASQFVVVSPAKATVVATPKARISSVAGAALTSKGSVFTWGDTGRMGLYAQVPSTYIPVPTATGTAGAIDVAVTGNNMYALLADGTVLAWGSNGVGAPGVGKPETRWIHIPEPVVGLPPAKAITAGGDGFALALTKEGRVFSWGNNEWGQLGLGDSVGRYSAEEVKGLADVVAIAASASASFVLKADGSVWGWGQNLGYQQAVNADRVSRPQQVRGLPAISKMIATPYNLFVQDSSGAVWVLGGTANIPTTDDAGLGPRRAPSLDGMRHVADNGTFLVLKADGTVWTTARQPTSSPGSGTTGLMQIAGITDATDVAAGGWGDCPTALIVRANGSVRTWGCNYWGALGDGTFSNRLTQTLVVSETGAGFMSLTGENYDNSLDPFKLLQIVGKSASDLNTRLTDLRLTGFAGDVYFTALLPRSSPLVRLMRKDHRDTTSGMIPMSFGRLGFKQIGPALSAESNSSGTLVSGSQYTIYEKMSADPLASSNVVICMGITIPQWSAKGQVLVRAIVTGDQVQGVTQCPTVQTSETIARFVGKSSGPINQRTITATIVPHAEERRQTLNIYSWAVAPDGTQFMQTNDGWVMMTEPMLAATTVTVPQSGDITVPIVQDADLSLIPGTLAYVGMGPSWELVRDLNMAGHYYTVQ